MLYLLGTGAAYADPHRTTTMLAFSDGGRTVVIDCGGDVVQRAVENTVAKQMLGGSIGPGSEVLITLEQVTQILDSQSAASAIVAGGNTEQ